MMTKIPDNFLASNCYVFADEAHIRHERRKAREARKSRWWQQKVGQGVCHYCQQRFTPKELTMDHIVPLARGGRTTPGNVVPACTTCNRAKGVCTPIDQIFAVPEKNFE